MFLKKVFNTPPQKIRNAATAMCSKGSGVAEDESEPKCCRNSPAQNECCGGVALSVADNPQRLRP